MLHHHQPVATGCNSHTSYSLYPTTIHQSQSSSSTSSLYNPAATLQIIQQIAAVAPHTTSSSNSSLSSATTISHLKVPSENNFHHHQVFQLQPNTVVSTSGIVTANNNNNITNNISGIHFNQANNIININTTNTNNNNHHHNNNATELTATSVNCYCPALIQQLPTGGTVAVCYQPATTTDFSNSAEFAYHHQQHQVLVQQHQQQPQAVNQQIISNQITTNNFFNNSHNATYLNGKEIMVRIPTNSSQELNQTVCTTTNFNTVTTTTTTTTITTPTIICGNLNNVGYFLPFDDQTHSLDSTDAIALNHKSLDQIHFNIEYDFYCNQAVEADSTTRSRPFSNNKKVYFDFPLYLLHIFYFFKIFINFFV